MHIYPVAESVCCRLLDLPVEIEQWVVTDADAEDMIAAGFVPLPNDKTLFRHELSGDLYQLARRQHYEPSTGELLFECDRSATLENELATRPITLLAMASDGGNIIDPFGGQDDMIDGMLRHVTPHFIHVPRNILIVALWKARLSHWGYSIAHGTHGLMKKMVSQDACTRLPANDVADAALHAYAAARPSAFFTVLQRCGALQAISPVLSRLYSGDAGHGDASIPAVMQALDNASEETQNVSHRIRVFYDLLGPDADTAFESLGLERLFE